VNPGDPAGQGYPGERLGRPEEGSGAVAGWGRRLAGICVDWAVALLVAHAFLGPWRSFGPLAVLLAMHVLLVGTAGSSLGHRLLGVRVERVHGGLPGPLRAAARAVLLCLLLPALISDGDRRGLHDRAAGTVPVRI
jgi:uncharacterized RDD family membrane protein YckC